MRNCCIQPIVQEASTTTKLPFLRQHAIHPGLCRHPFVDISAIKSGKKTPQQQNNPYLPKNPITTIKTTVLPRKKKYP